MLFEVLKVFVVVMLLVLEVLVRPERGEVIRQCQGGRTASKESTAWLAKKVKSRDA